MVSQIPKTHGIVAATIAGTKTQDANPGAGDDGGFHHVMQAAGVALSQSASASASTTVVSADLEQENATATVESIPQRPGLIPAEASGVALPSQVDTNEMVLQDGSHSNVVSKLTDHRGTGKSASPKRAHADEADATNEVTSAPAADVFVLTTVNAPEMSKPPAANMPVMIAAEAATSLPLSAGTSSGNARWNPGNVVGNARQQDDRPTDAVTSEEAQVVLAPGSFEKDAKHTGGATDEKSERQAVVTKIASPSATIAFGAMPVVEVGATFRSSFLHHAGPSTEGLGQLRDALEITTEPSAPANNIPVKHLEVSLKDAALGDISVRAEMKNGMLHASVLGVHADSFATASALHEFLDSNHVPVHTVQVESTSAHSQQKAMSTSTFASGLFERNESGRRNQQEQRRPMTPVEDVAYSVARNNQSAVPMRSAQVQYRDGSSLSIHI